MTSDKSVLTEDRLNALMDGGWLGPFFANKPSDTGRSSTSLSDDPDLILVVPSPATYKLEGQLIYTGGTGVSEGDLRVAMTITTGFLRWGILRKNNVANNTWVSSDKMVAGDTNVSLTNGTANDNTLRFWGTWVVNGAGPDETMSFRWCKDVAADGTTNTTLRQYSWMSLHRVA